MSATYYITTLGCPKNQADSREMERSLRRRGLRKAADATSSDFHLINSCSFIESARVETIQTVMEAAGLKRSGSEQKLILAGCFSERYSAAVRDELPEVDLSFGTGLYHRAGEIIGDRFDLPGRIQGDQAPGAAELIGLRQNEDVADDLGASHTPFAAVKISDGCNRGCAFCAIPGFRGAFRETPREEIVAECRQLAREGVREICLVSQDTNQYGGSPQGFIELLEELHAIPELHWIRLLYLYPDPRTEQLWEGIVERDLVWSDPLAGALSAAASGVAGAGGGRGKIVPYFESPVQHVSAPVLRAMRRYGDAEKFLKLFAKIRGLVPNVEIRTSLLLGYPGETEADIEAVLRFITEARPEKLALFSYSPEEGTPGYAAGDPIDAETKAGRINEVRLAHLDVLRELHRERVGRRVRCMVDQIEPGSGRIVARRAQDAPEVDEVVFVETEAAEVATAPAENELQVGDLLDVELTGFYEYDMTGTRIGSSTT
ncbi:MAG: radical SAM protein [bacterium]|nr:radical SAM protein [bacterium]